jgi:hypothetical protein
MPHYKTYTDFLSPMILILINIISRLFVGIFIRIVNI